MMEDANSEQRTTFVIMQESNSKCDLTTEEEQTHEIDKNN